MIKNKKAFTLIEALISTFITIIVFFGSMQVLYQLIETQKYSDKQLSLISNRNKLFSLLLDEKGWQTIAEDSSNSGFSCWIKQNSSNLSDRNCFNLNQGLFLKWIDGTKAYDGLNLTAGFDPHGNYCESFSAEPNPVNLNCPNHFNINWKVLCDSSPCQNPSIQIEGSLIYRASEKNALSIAPFNMQFIRSNIYCPQQIISNNILIVNAGVDVTSNSVISKATGNSANSGQASNNVDLYPCQLVTIHFSDQVVTSNSGLPGGLKLIDANNNSRVCIGSSASNCEFIWLRKSLNYELYYKGTLLAQKPAFITLDGSLDLQFQIINGLVRFCANGNCHYFFNQKLNGPFRVFFEPSNADYSGGFNNISIQTSKSFNYGS